MKKIDGLGDLVPFVQFKNVKNTHRVLLSVRLQEACTFFKLCKWYQIAQRITLYFALHRFVS